MNKNTERWENFDHGVQIAKVLVAVLGPVALIHMAALLGALSAEDERIVIETVPGDSVLWKVQIGNEPVCESYDTPVGAMMDALGINLDREINDAELN